MGALLLFATMFLRSDRGFDADRTVSRPTTQERGENGYLAAMEWLAKDHIRSISLRHRLQVLMDGAQMQAAGIAPRPESTVGSVGNVLIVTLPVTLGLRPEEFRALDKWVRAGNTLLVFAALADQPDWAYGFSSLASADLSFLTGLQFRSQGNPLRLDTSFIEPQRAHLEPNRRHAYFSGVREVVALSDFPRRSWQVSIPMDGFVLSLAHDRETHEGVLWTRALGSGRIVVSTFGSLFTNRALGLADNARLLANLIGANLGPQGAVLFDDVHQGLSAEYDPDKFFRDPRLYYTVGILAALWLAWVLGSTRLTVPVVRMPVPREAELIVATGGFLSRVLRSDAAARRILDLFLRRVVEYAPRAHASGADPWEFLERKVGSADLRQLQAWHTDAMGARRVPLSRLHNLILRIERQLLQ